MKELWIRCHCGRNLAICELQDSYPRAGADRHRSSGEAPRQVRRRRLFGSFQSFALSAGSGQEAAPDGYGYLDVVARPGVAQRHHQPAGQVVTYTWTCPDCGRTPAARAFRIGMLYEDHRSDPRRVVHVTFGTDL